MKHRFAAAALCLLASGCTSYPDAPEGYRGLFSPEEVLNRAVAAGGGNDDPMQDAEDLSIAVKVKHGDAPETSYRILWKKPGRWSIEITDGEHRGQRMVFDGERVAELKGAQVVRDHVPPEEVSVDRILRYLFALQFFRAGPGTRPMLEDSTHGPNGDPWIVLTKFDPSDRKVTLMLDVKTLKPMLVREWIPWTDGSLRPLDTYLSGHQQDARGGLLPTVTKTFSGTTEQEEMRIGTPAWNSRIPDSTFQIPRAP